MDLVLSVVALALLVPVLIFIATATRLSAARREQRFAAMRLAGATPRQISVIAAVESTVAAHPAWPQGSACSSCADPLAAIPFTGAAVLPRRHVAQPADILIVTIGVPVAAAVAARLALRRVHISPLGVTRRVTPKPPRAWRVLPLLAGLAELGFFVVHGAAEPNPGQVQASARIRAGHSGPGHGRAVADDGRGADHGPADQPCGDAHCRAASGRQSPGRVPGGQRPGSRAVHHHRGRRHDQHPRCQGTGRRSAPRPATS